MDWIQAREELIAKVTAMGIVFTLIAVPLLLFSGILMWTLSPFVKIHWVMIGLCAERIGIFTMQSDELHESILTLYIFGKNIMDIKDQ